MTYCPFNYGAYGGPVSGPYDDPDWIADETDREIYGGEEESHCVWDEVWWRKEGLGATYLL